MGSGAECISAARSADEWRRLRPVDKTFPIGWDEGKNDRGVRQPMMDGHRQIPEGKFTTLPPDKASSGLDPGA